MTMKIILLLCLYPVFPIMYYMMRSEAKFRKNILLGVTLPYAAREDSEIEALAEGYKRELRMIGILLGLLPFTVFFVKGEGGSMLILFGWMTLMILLPYVPYVRYHLRVKVVKQARGWVQPSAGVAMVDTAAMTESLKRVSSWWFLPPVLVSLVPVGAALLDWARGGAEGAILLWVYLLDVLVVASCYVFYRLLYRQRAEVVDDNAARTMALTRVRSYNWAKCWLWVAYLTAIMNVSLWLLQGHWALTVVMIVYTIALVAATMQAEIKTRRAQYTLARDSGQGLYTDEDSRWILGMFYFNPDDKHFMVKSRVGMGTTVNIARTGGKVFMGFAALCILLLPLSGVWLMAEENAQIQFTVTQEMVIVRHLARTYEIPREQIISIELVESLSGGMRVAGTGMENIAKGRYKFNGIGLCNACLKPGTPPYMVIRTDTEAYVVNAGEAALTEQYYLQLQLE